MRYRRAEVTGGTYFFTVNLVERNRTLLVDHVDTLRQVVRTVKREHPFHIDARVILPNHLHTVWTLPMGDYDDPTASGHTRRFTVIGCAEFFAG